MICWIALLYTIANTNIKINCRLVFAKEIKMFVMGKGRPF